MLLLLLLGPTTDPCGCVNTTLSVVPGTTVLMVTLPFEVDTAAAAAACAAASAAAIYARKLDLTVCFNRSLSLALGWGGVGLGRRPVVICHDL